MDREKVLTWLEICGKDRNCSGTCPYSEHGFGEYGECREQLMEDALVLLKENCHKCKLECLLQKYDELKEKYDALLKEQEAVVLCKDCAHGTLWSGNIKCVKPGMKRYEMDLHPVNWFCADRKRRSDNE